MNDKSTSISDDDRAVSPVIGVILMVAITVILAAVIGTFVLGLGDSLEQAPQAQLDASLSAGNVEISHNGGDAIPASDLTINIADAGAEDFETDAGTGHEGDFSVGETATAGEADEGQSVIIVHEPSDSILLDTEL